MTSPVQDDLSKLLLPIQPDDHIHGQPDAAVTIVEYGDYQCPECGKLFCTIRELQRELERELRIVFRHYPLSGLHPNAQVAAEAAEAAGAQERFWEMHDALFEHQGDLDKKHLIQYAEQLQLDMERFRKELKHGVYADRVRDDFQRGVQNGVYGTPGLFVNGIRHNGPRDKDALLARFKEVK